MWKAAKAVRKLLVVSYNSFLICLVSMPSTKEEEQ
jgi:hypothetical protein